MAGMMEKVWKKVAQGLGKEVQGGKSYMKIDSVEQGHNLIAAAEKEHASGKHKADVEISTAVESDLIKYLNYNVSLMDEKYALHKMLLILRINPIKTNPKTGDGVYLSKKYIAQELSKYCKKNIKEDRIEALEKEAIKICQDSIASTKDTKIPIL